VASTSFLFTGAWRHWYLTTCSRKCKWGTPRDSTYDENMYLSATKRLSVSCFIHRLASPCQTEKALEHGGKYNPNHRLQNHSAGATKLFYPPRHGAVGQFSAPLALETAVEPHYSNSFGFKVWFKTRWDFGLEKEGPTRWSHNKHCMDPQGAPVNFKLTSKLGFWSPGHVYWDLLASGLERVLLDDDQETCRDHVRRLFATGFSFLKWWLSKAPR